MNGPLVNIAICMLLCFLTFGGFRFLLHSRGIGYVRHFLWTTAYFLSIAVITTIFYWSYIASVLDGAIAVPLLVLVLFMTVQALFYLIVPTIIRRPDVYFEANPDRYFLDINWRRFISKSADILAQQVFILLLILFLQRLGLTVVQTILAFGVLFGMLHIPLIASEWGAWPAWAFGGIVIVFSIVFPILILTVPYGFVYTYILHWLFYTVMATSFWMRVATRAA